MASPYALIDEDRAANIADVLLYILSNKPEHDHSFKHPPGNIFLAPQVSDEIIRELHNLGWTNPVQFMDTIKGIPVSKQVAGQSSSIATQTDDLPEIPDLPPAPSHIPHIVPGGTTNGGIDSEAIIQRINVLAREVQRSRGTRDMPAATGLISSPDGISRIDINDLRDELLGEIQNGDSKILEQIKRLYNIAPEKSKEQKSLMEGARDAFASISNRATSYLPYKRKINVRNTEFILNDKYTTENEFSAELKATFGDKIKVLYGGNPPTDGKKVVVLRLEPSGSQDTFYNFLETYIRRHSNSGVRLYINENDTITDEAKINEYKNGLVKRIPSSVSSVDGDSWKSFVVALRLIHMEMLREINKIVQTLPLSGEDSLFVLLPFGFVKDSVISLSHTEPEYRIYGIDYPPGFKFLKNTITIENTGDNKPVLFNETSFSKVKQSLEETSKTEKVLSIMADVATQIVKGRGVGDKTFNVLQYLFYNREEGIPVIISVGSIQRLKEMLSGILDDIENELKPETDSIFSYKYSIRRGDINNSIVSGNQKTRFKYISGPLKTDHDRAGILTHADSKEFLEYDTIREYVMDLYQKMKLIYDVLKTSTNKRVPQSIRNEYESLTDSLDDIEFKLNIITNIGLQSPGSAPAYLNRGKEYLKNTISFIGLLGNAYVLLGSYMKIKGASMPILDSVKGWVDTSKMFNTLRNEDLYEYVNRRKDNYIGNKIDFINVYDKLGEGVSNIKKMIQAAPIDDSETTPKKMTGPSARTRSRVIGPLTSLDDKGEIQTVSSAPTPVPDRSSDDYEGAAGAEPKTPPTTTEGVDDDAKAAPAPTSSPSIVIDSLKTDPNVIQRKKILGINGTDKETEFFTAVNENIDSSIQKLRELNNPKINKALDDILSKPSRQRASYLMNLMLYAGINPYGYTSVAIRPDDTDKGSRHTRRRYLKHSTRKTLKKKQ
jgi:hypothetical protein